MNLAVAVGISHKKFKSRCWRLGLKLDGLQLFETSSAASFEHLCGYLRCNQTLPVDVGLAKERLGGLELQFKTTTREQNAKQEALSDCEHPTAPAVFIGGCSTECCRQRTFLTVCKEEISTSL